MRASARAWIVAALGEGGRRSITFAAVSTKLDLVEKFGIELGSRVSASGTGSAAVTRSGRASGSRSSSRSARTASSNFLRGGYDIDTHFREAPMEANIPDVDGASRRLVPQCLGICDPGGHPLRPATRPLLRPISSSSIWRATASTCMSTAAHVGMRKPARWSGASPAPMASMPSSSCLHQGTSIVPIDFLVAAEPTKADLHHHEILVSNCLAQAQALMLGRDLDGREGDPGQRRHGAGRHRGAWLRTRSSRATGRPPTFMYKALDPRMLGRLIALYEHRVFTMAAIWDTNPFDQWGVELGKELASNLGPIVSDSAQLRSPDLDGSTAGLVKHRRALIHGLGQPPLRLGVRRRGVYGFDASGTARVRREPPASAPDSGARLATLDWTSLRSALALLISAAFKVL